MGTHSSVLASRILGMVEPDGLPSMGSHRVRHDWSDLASAAAALISLYNQKYKKLFQTIKDWTVTGKIGSPVSPLLYFLAEFPSGTWTLAMSTYLPWLPRPMQEGAQGGAPFTIQAGAGGLGRWCKPLVSRFY